MELLGTSNSSGKVMKTPILFLIFNRPAETAIVLERLRSQKVPILYVAADGARANNESDQKLCAECRSLIDTIDWDCKVYRLFRDENLGCGKAVSEAITWFFKNEEMGIILEDDCLPANSFFGFCESLLEYYKDDSRVMHISGNNFQFGQIRGNASYYFSIYPHIWGWATWRRAWNLYDFEMKEFPALMNDPILRKYYPGEILIETYNKKIDTWDSQWVYTVYKNHGLSILPNVNLVKNIGFTKRSTHTSNEPFWYKRIGIGEITEIIHMDKLEIDTVADDFTVENIYLAKENIVKRVIRKVFSLIKSSA